MNKLRKRGKACEIFDPLFLKGKENNIEQLKNIAGGLKHFEYRDFDDKFLANLEKEIPLAVEHANKEFDWNSIKETDNFKTIIDRKIKRRKLNDDHILDWKDDPGERASKTW